MQNYALLLLQMPIYTNTCISLFLSLATVVFVSDCSLPFIVKIGSNHWGSVGFSDSASYIGLEKQLVVYFFPETICLYFEIES